MRKAFLPLIATLFLILLAALIVPLFISTDLLKSQVEKTVKDQTGMTLAISGDVSFSLLTGFSLSAEAVALQDQDNNPLFSVERLDFGLALMPLLSGKADISGLVLRKPVFTLASTEATSPTIANNGTAPNNTTNSNQEIDLSALKLRHLEIRDGSLISRNIEEGTETVLVGGINSVLSIPDFNSTASISGSLEFQNKEQSFSGSIAQIGAVINGRASPLVLDISSDVFKARLEGTVSPKGPEQGQPLLAANYALNAGSVSRLLGWLGVSPNPVNVSKLALQGSVIASDSEVQIRALNAALDEQIVEMAARAYFASHLERPLIRLAIDAPNFNLDTLLAQPEQSESPGIATATQKTAEQPQTPPDLSALSTFDATLDFRSNRLTAEGIAIRNIKLLAHLNDGQLSAHVKSANLAKGSIETKIDGDLSSLVWKGFFAARGLGLEELAGIAGQQSTASGILSTDLDFAAKGVTKDALLNSSNMAGKISLTNGQFSHPALQAAVAGRESGTLSNIATTLTLEGLEKPALVQGSFGWNGEVIRYSSQLGLAEALAGAPIPASLTADSRPLRLSLAGNFNPTRISLNGSRLSIKTASSKALLQWMGQSVSSGTPDMPVDLSTNLDISQSQTKLSNMALVMGQSKGNGSVTFSTSGKTRLNADIAFDKLDVTPFMGDGSAKGRSGGKASTANKQQGWDQSPIDFSGLNALDADVSFSTKSLIARDVVTGPVILNAKLKSGQLTTSLDSLSLYGGNGTGGVTINGQSNPAQISANFALQKLNMANFLRDTTSLRSLAGTGNVTLDLQTAGRSQAEIINNLNGISNIDIRDGQIRGINIPQMLRSLRGNILEGWANSDSQSTDFSALTAKFNITNGIASNNDLQMLSPLLRMTGAGSIDLPQQRVDYKVTPKLVSKLKGSGWSR